MGSKALKMAEKVRKITINTICDLWKSHHNLYYILLIYKYVRFKQILEYLK